MYFDQFDRPIEKHTRNFADSDYIKEITEFNRRGFVAFQSVPFDESQGDLASIGTHYDEHYDALGTGVRSRFPGRFRIA